MNKRARFTAENAQATFTSLKGLMASVDEDVEPPASHVVEVELARIRPNPDQPRRTESAGFSKSSIEELAENIREHGLLQPILVKDTGRFFQIVAGERRFRACQMLGMERVPVRLVEPRDEQDELQIALAENLQRKNLGALEEALAFRTLIHRFGLSYRDLARLSGRSLAHVHGRLQLLEYDDVREAVEDKRVGIADAIQLARVPDEASRKELLAAVADGSLRGAALHRQVQVFLGELSPEAAQGDDQRVAGPKPGLRAAVEAIETLPEELSTEQARALHELLTRAAERLNLQLMAPTEQPADVVPSDPRVQERPGVPPPVSPEGRKAINRTKEHRDARGYTMVNLIRVYWMSMERRGYAFTPGEWRATPGGNGQHLVSFTYKVDNEPRAMEWWYRPDGSVEPANDDARNLGA